jgi:hypothetical protein
MTAPWKPGHWNITGGVVGVVLLWVQDVLNNTMQIIIVNICFMFIYF